MEIFYFRAAMAFGMKGADDAQVLKLWQSAVEDDLANLEAVIKQGVDVNGDRHSRVSSGSRQHSGDIISVLSC